MKKILFLIRDLGHGGAEKVLVNLANHMDRNKFDITVMTLFDEGVNRQFLSPDIKYKSCFRKSVPGNSHILKIFSPEFLHRTLIKEKYDIEVAYLEGPAARIISGCPDKDTKLFSWIHIEFKNSAEASASFRSQKEAEDCYNKFDKIIGVSQSVIEKFTTALNITTETDVLYNTNNTKDILEKAAEDVEDGVFDKSKTNICAVGRLVQHKRFDRLINIQKNLKENGYNTHLYILGTGEEENNLKNSCSEYGITDSVTFLGYQTNPYKYVANCDLFVCASMMEGFSTAATEALIVGTPVCTVEVAGMKEMLGYNNEYGIVTENDETALLKAIKDLLDSKEKLEYYKEKAIERGKFFSTEKTVAAAENMFINE